jgi:hypothetical protein
MAGSRRGGAKICHIFMTFFTVYQNLRSLVAKATPLGAPLSKQNTGLEGHSRGQAPHAMKARCL